MCESFKIFKSFKGLKGRMTLLTPILIYRVSTVYLPCIYRICTVVDKGKRAKVI